MFITKDHKSDFFDEIVSIADCGEAETFDIEVDHEDHSFYANDFVVSNSHAVSYAIDSYYGAWLMTHYETDWLATCLQSENSNVEGLTLTMSEIKQLGYNISQSDVNHSSTQWDWSDDLKAFIPPLSSLKGIGDAAVMEIMNNRPYRSLEDLLFDTDGNWRHSKFNKRALQALISMESLGSLEEFADGRLQNHKQLWHIIVDNMDALRKGKFGTTPKKAAKLNIPPLLDTLLQQVQGMDDWGRYEKLKLQTETSGSAAFHLIFPPEVLKKIKDKDVQSLAEVLPGSKSIAWFCITGVEKKNTKNGKTFLRARTLDTSLGVNNVRIWGDLDVKPYSIWVGVVDHDANWGFSTNVGKLREIA